MNRVIYEVKITDTFMWNRTLKRRIFSTYIFACDTALAFMKKGGRWFSLGKGMCLDSERGCWIKGWYLENTHKKVEIIKHYIHTWRES